MVPKMTLCLGVVNLADHIAGSISIRLEALWELSKPSGKFHLQLSYIPLPPCKLQAVCWSERLHVTACDRVW